MLRGGAWRMTVSYWPSVRLRVTFRMLTLGTCAWLVFRAVLGTAEAGQLGGVATQDGEQSLAVIGRVSRVDGDAVEVYLERIATIPFGTLVVILGATSN